tara:strand:- start:315 stop:1349 length:1035 start_codon:yes stop_codon:yes gene_type:complete
MKIFLQKNQSNFLEAISNYDKYSKSKYWQKSISFKKKLFNIKYLNNFRSNNLSKNIDDFYLSKQKIEKLYLILQKKCGKKFINKFILKKQVGNPKKFIKKENKLITASDLFHIKYIFDLNKSINIQNINTICEIGQGFGLLASKLLKIKKFKIILIDLPESNFITTYFLKKIYPTKKIVMDKDLPKKLLTKKIFQEGDIFIISPWIKIDKIKIDLFINSRSMMEMNYESIFSYFKLIEKKVSIRGYFLCINRYYKDLVGYPIEFHRYPYSDMWKTIISKKSWQQPHIHFLLTKKVNKKHSNIKQTLNDIKEKYKQLVKSDNFIIRRVLPIGLYRSYKLIKNNFF